MDDTSANHPATSPIVLFDGVCGLCDASVKFIIDHDPAATFRFSPLQTDAGRQLQIAHRIDPANMSSIVLIDGGRAYLKSSAALRIGRRLQPTFWRLLAWFGVVIPPPVRDAVYDFVARNRYRWFGKFDACRMPTAAEAARFIS